MNSYFRNRQIKNPLPPNFSVLPGTIDYKNIILLQKFITFEGKIRGRRLSQLSAKQQRYITKAIKNARIMGLLPFINKQRPGRVFEQNVQTKFRSK